MTINRDNSEKDRLYRESRQGVEPFVFDSRVAAVFDDMISRSVPRYLDVQQLTRSIAIKVVTPGSAIYDLGCSTGGSIIALLSGPLPEAVRIVGVDNSEPMLERCSNRLAEAGVLDPSFPCTVELICADLCDVATTSASLVLLNYTLQFLPPTERQTILSRVFSELLPGGCLLLSEKIRHQHQIMDQVITELHHGFKQHQGYSQLEISQKRQALENVLVPATLDENIEMLRSAGFGTVELMLKDCNFVTLCAIK